MTPTIPISTTNVSLTPGTFFTRRPNNCLTRCSNFQRSTKQTLFFQAYIFPLSTSARLCPQFRSGCNLLSKSRICIASATRTDETVEEQDSQVADGGTLGVLSNANDPTENSSLKSDATAGPVWSKHSRPVRKSEMPPVKNEELVAGATFTGKVRSIQPFGAFIDFGAFTDGLVHVSRLSDSFVEDVGSVVSVGQEVKVRLVEANTDTGRISLTMRESDDTSKLQQQKDVRANSDTTRPSRRNASKPGPKKEDVKKSSKFAKGQYLEGTVKNITRSGAFISLAEGEEGFLPLSEESDDPFASIMGNSSLQVGQKVNVRVLRIAKARLTLTMKKEEDAGELDSKLSQGVVHIATNPFVLAFRQNKDIASFLDEREKVEAMVENSGMEEASEDVRSKEFVNEPSAVIETISDSGNSTEELDVDASAVEDYLTETTIQDDDSESIVADQQVDEVVDGVDTQEIQDITMSDGKKLFSDPSTSDETVDDAESSIKEVDAEVTAVVDSLTGAAKDGPESGVSGQPENLSVAVADVKNYVESSSKSLSEVENDGESEIPRQISGETPSLESIIAEDASQAEDLIFNDELDEISGVEDKAPHSKVEEENVSLDTENNGSITSSNGQIDVSSPPETRTEEKQIADVAVENQINNTISNDKELINTLAADCKNSSSKEDHAPDKNGSVANSNGQGGATSQKESSAKAAISPALVKKLREETGAGMMDCKKALSETGGDIVIAQEFLRKKGLASAEKKASRATAEGRIGSYIHDSRIGVLVEVNCETDFVSRGDIFKELVDDLAMQVAACPGVQYLDMEDVPQEFVETEREIETQKEDLSAKPEQIRCKIVEGRIRKRLEELALLEQPYIKNDKVVVKDLMKQKIATIGENIKVKRFVRYNLGEGLEKRSQDFAAEVAAQITAKPVPAPGKDQPAMDETKETVEMPSKVTISAALVKQLREETGAGIMDCKKALSETEGDLEKAQEYLRKKGLSAADKKSSRLAAEGRIGSYIHDSRIGVLLEVNCETDFVGRSEKFKELVDDLAMQVVACPNVEYVSIEDIPDGIVNKEKEREMRREDILSKPEDIQRKIVDGRVSKRLGELALLEQPFIKNDNVLVKDLVKKTVAALGENIKVRRFIRFTLGQTGDAKTELKM